MEGRSWSTDGPSRRNGAPKLSAPAAQPAHLQQGSATPEGLLRCLQWAASTVREAVELHACDTAINASH